MLLSINWLKDFIPAAIPATDIAEKLTMAGIEVEDIIQAGSRWNNVFVGDILEIAPHPNADKLSLAKVQCGSKIFSVVCGAPNISVGQKVPLALEGALLPNGLKIKRSKIRGQSSEGMICSEIELALGDDSSGIMVLPPETQSGLPFAESLNLYDTILDLGITPNRSDCLSVIGLAREISAIFKTPFVIPDCRLTEDGPPVEEMISVEIHAADLCPRYTARVLSDVSIQPSPLWMKTRLENCGIRAINNIVDITNYILLEWGQPLHAFDLNMINSDKIIVKRAEKGETFITLDETERILDTDMVMICDAATSVAIGGVMGGLHSGVSADTASILLESAYFTPASINKTSRTLNLKTESSQRFEKGIDIQGVAQASHRAALLMAQLSGGKISQGVLDIYPAALPQPKPIVLDMAKANKIIGFELSPNEAQDILERLSFQTTLHDNNTLATVPPGFRYDIAEPIDIIEEIARIKGYEHIPTTYPKACLSAKPESKAFLLASLMRNIMISLGFYEVINYSFFSPDCITGLKLSAKDPRCNPIHVLNPLSLSQSVMRTTILPSLLVNLKDNCNNKISNLKIFEIANIFLPATGGNQPDEIKMIAGLVSGLRYGQTWNLPQQETDFFDIKGMVETVLERLRIWPYLSKNDRHEPFLHPKKMLSYFVHNEYIGSIGELHPDILENFGIECSSVCVFELNLDRIGSYFTDDVMFEPFSRFPAVYRDVALIVDQDIPAEKVYETIIAFKNKLICEVAFFDYYHGSTIPEGKKSLAYRIKFQSNERTLTDKEVNKIHENLLKHLSRSLGAELR